MNMKEMHKKRYSVRAYLSQKVEKEKIDYILDCARLAPSAANFQPWLFYVIEDPKVQKELHKAYQKAWFAVAPVYIIVCKDISQSWKRPIDGKDHGDIDAAIASQNICLAAFEQGLGTCWICNFNPQMVCEILQLDVNIEPIAIFPIAYIDEEKSKVPNKTRKDISETVRYI